MTFVHQRAINVIFSALLSNDKPVPTQQVDARLVIVCSPAKITYCFRLPKLAPGPKRPDSTSHTCCAGAISLSQPGRQTVSPGRAQKWPRSEEEQPQEASGKDTR